MKIYDVRGIGASLTGSFSGSFKGLFTGPLDGVAATSSYVEYSNVVNKPALVSGSSQVLAFNVFATTGSNQFNGNQSITGSLTVTGQVIAQTLNVQQVTSSIVFSSGSNRFGNNSGNTHRFTGSVSITGSLTVNGSGLVPYTGATQDVNLGVYSIATNGVLANQITVNPSGTTAAQVFLKHGSSFSLPNGFGSIGSSTGNQFRLYQVSSEGVWRGAGISLNSITPSETRVYTLPDASGTIALTSALSDYVTIATTQTITGAKTFNTTTSEFAGFNSTNASGGVLTFRRSGTNVGHIGNSAQLGGGVLDAIEVRSGTGSSVILKSDGGQVTLATGGGVTLTGALNGTSASFKVSTDRNLATRFDTQITLSAQSDSGAPESLRIYSDTFRVFTSTTAGGLTERLSISNTGAATFSSSVTANDTVTVNTSVTPLRFGNLIRWGFQRPGSDNRYISFMRNMDATATPVWTVDGDNGNVGIGTASPSANLHVIRANDGGSGTPGVILRTDNGANDIVRFQDGTTIVAVVKNDGSIGIGTPTPTNKLHLTGASSTPSLRLGSTSVGFHWDIGRENQSTGDFVFNSTNVSTGTTEKMRITQDSVAYLRMASGTGGIQFNGDTAAANALDDYEEGTWTPTLPNGGAITINNARYVKVGQKVTVSFYATSVTPTNNSSDFLIGGLPFPNAGYTPSLYFGGSFAYVATGNLNRWLALTGVNFTYIYFHANNGTAAGARLTNADYLTDAGSNRQLIITITYFAAT